MLVYRGEVHSNNNTAPDGETEYLTVTGEREEAREKVLSGPAPKKGLLGEKGGDDDDRENGRYHEPG